jgi:hypothetical protein
MKKQNKNNNKKTIVETVEQILTLIPEKGAIIIPDDMWESVTSKPCKAWGKINGRLEWLEVTDSTDRQTVYVWHYIEHPLLESEFFAPYMFPFVFEYETVENVFV